MSEIAQHLTIPLTFRLGMAEQVENVYLAIRSMQVSVSSI